MNWDEGLHTTAVEEQTEKKVISELDQISGNQDMENISDKFLQYKNIFKCSYCVIKD
ncbi:MAG: hypothetical protein OEV55_08795 [candidate division Zixibacteria bacterium]|nr:hypothetical protein [candidate division Zixibacteria bacterium]